MGHDRSSSQCATGRLVRGAVYWFPEEAWIARFCCYGYQRLQPAGGESIRAKRPALVVVQDVFRQ